MLLTPLFQRAEFLLHFAPLDIQIADVNLLSDRCLELEHKVRHGRIPVEGERAATLKLACNVLWGYPIQLRGTDEDGDEVYTVKVEPDEETE